MDYEENDPELLTDTDLEDELLVDEKKKDEFDDDIIDGEKISIEEDYFGDEY